MSSRPPSPVIAASCKGVDVPDTPLLNAERIERINLARYEGQEIEGALSVIGPDDRVLEMGAGIGLVGAIAAKTGGAAAVLSFEANPRLIPHINALYDLNGITDKIAVRHAVVLTDNTVPDTVPFHVRSSFLGSSLVESDKRPSDQIDVPCADFHQIKKDFAPTVILMDIEGGELAFLRNADLSGVRAIVIEFHPEAYGREGMRECKNLLRRKGFLKSEDVSSRHVWTCTYDVTLEKPQPDSGWATQMTVVENAIVVPPVEDGFEQAAGVLHADGSYCHTGAMWRYGRALTQRPDRPRGHLPRRSGTWLWGGLLWMHFGHFLVESTARLWALEHLDEDIEGVLFMPKKQKSGSDVVGFQQDFVSLMGSDAPVVCTDTPCQVDRLIVPGQGFGLGALITGTDKMRGSMKSKFARDIAPEGAEKLYISRSALGAGKGGLIGEIEMEQALEAEGYRIFHPQKHDLRAQIAQYKAAKQVIAAEGSALHLFAMVARPEQQVAMVVRRPSGTTAQIQKHLHAFAGINPVMISALSRSWRPKGQVKSRTWKGELDLPAVQLALQKTGFCTARRPWRPLIRSDILNALGDRYEEVA